MENRKRNIQIKFRVTEEERTLIEEKMKQVPTSNMEAYLRKMVIDGYIIQVDHSYIKKMTVRQQVATRRTDNGGQCLDPRPLLGEHAGGHQPIGQSPIHCPAQRDAVEHQHILSIGFTKSLV